MFNTQVVMIQASPGNINHQPLFFQVNGGGAFARATPLLVQHPNPRFFFSVGKWGRNNNVKHFYNYNNVVVTAVETDLLSGGGEETDEHIPVTAVVTVKTPVVGIGIDLGLDYVTDLSGKSLLLELVRAQLDPKTGLEKAKITGYAHKKVHKGNDMQYEAKFTIPADFGEIGAVRVENEHHNEMFLQDIVIDGFPSGPVHFTCHSWVHSTHDNKQKRIFFTNYVRFFNPISTGHRLDNSMPRNKRM